eukprot:TRINITY_DN8564_c0_g1_i1.p1 TRINITY_DN8564_c0_g1~~TRINITY_DN8564_c0_g1_i1.p1  ORF type:complete len:418 (+),score=26.42 TRINITY_DN8564_c0_g1_i1:46-1299(+)
MDVYIRKENGTRRLVEIQEGTTTASFFTQNGIREDEEVIYEGEELDRNDESPMQLLGVLPGDELKRTVTMEGKVARACRAAGWKVNRQSLLQAVRTDTGKARHLIRAGVKPDFMVLLKAVQAGDHEMAAAILTRKEELAIDVNKIRYKFIRPFPNRFPPVSTFLLKEAVRNLDLSMAELLLKHGALPNLIDSKGETALTFLCMQNGDTVPIAELLLKHGATVLARRMGRTARSPLSCAVVRNDLSMVKLLLPVVIENKVESSKCLSLAVHGGKRPEIVEYMKHRGLHEGMTVVHWEKHWENHRRMLEAKQEGVYDSSDEELLEGFRKSGGFRRKLKAAGSKRMTTSHHGRIIANAWRSSEYHDFKNRYEAFHGYVELTSWRESSRINNYLPFFQKDFTLPSPVRKELSYADSCKVML